MNDRLKAIVIGGGIGGLAAAIALHRAEIDVVSYERAAELREVPAGLVLWPNAIKALTALGFGPQIKSMGAPQADITIRTSRGRRMCRIKAAKFIKRFGHEAIVVPRTELLTMLFTALPPGTVQMHKTCTSVLQNDKQVRVQFGSADVVMADFLVGADGLYSTVREQLIETQPVRYGGYTAWRAITRFPNEKLIPGESFGRGLRFGHAAMTRGRVYWWASRTLPEDKGEGRSQPKEELRSLFKDWHDPIPELIDATDEAFILQNDAYDRPPLNHWSDGRITLLGDAAHPMMPDLGQGACQALEDAVVLGDCFKSSQLDIPEALRIYQSRRILRTTQVVQEAYRCGHIAQWETPMACRLRNAFMSTPIFRRRLLRRWDELMQFDG